jgi:hypothetical protein
MVLDGGGWTLVGRSSSGDTISSSIGWGVASGSVTNDTAPYSLNTKSAGLAFDEIAFGSYSSGKTWGNNVYKHTVASNFMSAYATTHYGIGSPAVLKGTCAPSSGPTMFVWIGFTNNLDTFHLRDVDGNGYGLSGSGFRTCYDNCEQGGFLNGQPGMFMVR